MDSLIVELGKRIREEYHQAKKSLKKVDFNGIVEKHYFLNKERLLMRKRDFFSSISIFLKELREIEEREEIEKEIEKEKREMFDRPPSGIEGSPLFYEWSRKILLSKD